MVRIVHAADLHLDSPLRGLGRLDDDDLAHELRRATRAAFDRLIAHCLGTCPDALIIAGDVYDGNWRDYSTGEYFTRGMRDLAEAGIHVLLVQGNHDAESVITRSLVLPPNVTVLRTDQPETRIFDNTGLAVHGQGFSTKAVNANLAIDYPSPVPGLVNVGVLHTSVQGYAGHNPYAPCTVADLGGRGYEYFALGHVHSRQTLSEGEHAVAFSGNLQGRHPREGGPKGALDVHLTAGEAAQMAFVPLDVARWELITVDLTGVDDAAAAFDRVEQRIAAAREAAETRPLVVRVRLVGTSPVAAVLADTDRVGHEVRPRAERHRVAVEKLTSEVTTPVARRTLPASQRAAIEGVLAAALEDPTALLADPELKADFDALVSEVNERFLRPIDVDLRDPERRAALVREAVHRLQALADGGAL